MKPITIFLSLSLIFGCVPLTAQFKVRSDYYIQIGYEDYRTLSFGVYDIPPGSGHPNNGRCGIEHWEDGLNAYIPWPAWNYGNYKLHVADWGNVGIGYRAVYGYKLDVDGDIRATGNMYAVNLTSSDRNLKTDIAPLEGSLEKILQLRSVSYRYIRRDYSKAYQPPEGTEYANEEQRLRAEATALQAKNSGHPDGEYKGFIAQEVQEIVPELIHVDPEGNLAMDYTSVISMLVEAVQEQQAQIEALTARLDQQSPVPAPNKLQPTHPDPIQGQLYQNHPNPFTSQTSIQYQLHPDTRTAQLMIFNFQGVLIRTESLAVQAEGEFTLEGQSLKPGMYFYSLVADGEEIDIKRMILTE